MKQERIQIIEWIEQAQSAGARQLKACHIVGISPKILQRWRLSSDQQDGRLNAQHQPKNKLTEQDY